MPIASNWWVNTQPGPAFPGGATYGGGGASLNTAGAVQYRSPLDAARAARGHLPHAEYPDGYLGTIVDRHEDKLLDAVQQRLTERSYQRGVHKGERIPRTDYFWDKTVVDPMEGIKRQARSVREGNTLVSRKHVNRGNPVERLAHLGKLGGLSTPEQLGLYKQYGVSVSKNPVVLTDPTAQARLQKMRPTYAW